MFPSTPMARFSKFTAFILLFSCMYARSQESFYHLICVNQLSINMVLWSYLNIHINDLRSQQNIHHFPSKYVHLFTLHTLSSYFGGKSSILKLFFLDTEYCDIQRLTGASVEMAIWCPGVPLPLYGHHCTTVLYTAIGGHSAIC